MFAGKKTREKACRALLAGLGGVAVVLFSPLAFAQSLHATQVFLSLSQHSSPAERAAYLASTAGSVVEGEGRMEVVLPRTYYDTSVPDANPAVALIQLGADQKIACGLVRVPSREEFGRLPEGAAVGFRGSLVDAHDWDAWSTLYLGSCTLSPR